MINTYSYFSLDSRIYWGVKYILYLWNRNNENDIKFRKKGGVGYDDK